MRIVQFIAHLSSGGAERFTVNLCNELSNLGHEVHLIILNSVPESALFNKQFLQENVHFYPLKLKGIHILKKTKELNGLIKIIKPDVIHCHLASIQYFLPTYLFSHIKVFHTLHNVAAKASGGGIQAKLYKFLYWTKFVKPITISDICHDSYIEYFHLDNDVMIPNGSAPAITTDKLSNVQTEIKSYKQTPNTKVFIHIARYNQQKNQNLLVDSFNKLNDEGLDFTLLVLGRDFDYEDGKKLVNKSCEKIHFLGLKSNVADYLACSDAFCLTSIYEGLPISLLEAMSLGVTPICTAVGGIPDVVTDGRTGYLAQDVNLESYTDAVKRYLANKLDKDTIIAEFNDNYSMRQCAKKYIEVYNKSC